jgi:aspartyl-tRNA(Asn)/glutamyl-tRNA(Gln) amidotransferase subunit A
MEGARAVSLVIQMPEALSYHSTHMRTKSSLYGDDLRSGFALGQFILAEHYVRAKRMMSLYRQQMTALFEDVDLLVTPTSPMIAPPRGTTTVTIAGREEALGDAYARFTYFFNLTGHPAMSLPSGWHSTGLPMGVQLVARHFEEGMLLRAGDAIEQSLNLPKRRPMLS